MRTRTDGVRARLARVEKLAGKGPCPCCRLEQAYTRREPAKSCRRSDDASLAVASRCEFCGTPFKQDLSGYPEELREVVRLYYASDLESLFTDPRVWAARRWMAYWAEARRQDRRAARDGPEPPTPLRPLRGRHGCERQRRGRGREGDPNVRLYVGLLAQAKALLDRRLWQFERRYGKNPFPEFESRVAAILSSDLGLMSPTENLAHARETLKRPAHGIGSAWLLCAEMERIVLGGVSAYTSRMLAGSERRARERAAGLKELMEKGEFQTRLNTICGCSFHFLSKPFKTPSARCGRARQKSDGGGFAETFLVPTHTLRPRALRLGVRFYF